LGDLVPYGIAGAAGQAVPIQPFGYADQLTEYIPQIREARAVVEHTRRATGLAHIDVHPEMELLRPLEQVELVFVLLRLVVVDLGLRFQRKQKQRGQEPTCGHG